MTVTLFKDTFRENRITSKICLLSVRFRRAISNLFSAVPEPRVLDGRQQEPGGWNRMVLQVQDLPARITELKKEGVHFRNEMEVGPGGRQIQLEDPDGNPIELFEPAQG